MIRRVVKMTFQPEKIEAFMDVFAESSPHIRAYPGCLHLELWRAEGAGNVLFTFSHWSTAADLEHYRRSELFQSTWARTKVLFADRPEAWSVDQIAHLP
ncbi:MAG: antibiotic biosynthesis monooxygenase [Lewinella sp.]|nr:antibiotic biosynthesis monooxygenase [Lewinella sp.]